MQWISNSFPMLFKHTKHISKKLSSNSAPTLCFIIRINPNYHFLIAHYSFIAIIIIYIHLESFSLLFIIFDLLDQSHFRTDPLILLLKYFFVLYRNHDFICKIIRCWKALFSLSLVRINKMDMWILF